MKSRFIPWLLLIGLVGCGERKSAPPPAAKPVANPSATVQETPILSSADAAAMRVGAKTPAGEADLAWLELEKALEAPSFPPEWQLQPPSKEQIEEFRKKNGAVADKAAEQARQFYTKYPDHANAAQARDHERDLLTVAAELGNTNVIARLEKLEQARLEDPALPEDERLQLRVQQIQRQASARAGDDLGLLLTELEKEARNLKKEFPKRSELNGLLMQIAQAQLNRGESDKSRKLAQEIAAAEADPELKQQARDILSKLERVGKPLDIKFKAVDGREIDLQKMRGKVVLVDFWATWCGPCMKELPNVKAAYEKLHAKGFEIVGISLDRDLDKLKQVVEREKMTWPQYFETEAETGNRFAREFGISSIPAMWLVDKKGVLRSLSARDDLAARVENLLAEN